MIQIEYHNIVGKECCFMCHITVTELKKNLGYYLELSKSEDVYVTKKGKVITLLTSPDKKSFVDIDSLVGKYNPDGKNIDYEKLLEEAIMEKCGF